MLDYISKQLKARMHANDPDPIQEEAQMDTAILECAHLFQELRDETDRCGQRKGVFIRYMQHLNQ